MNDSSRSGVDAPQLDAPDPTVDGLGPDRARFRDYLDRTFRAPLHAALEQYGRALDGIIDAMGDLAAAPLDPEAGYGETARARYDFAARFLEAFGDDFLDPADRARDAFFEHFDPPEPGPEMPEIIEAGPATPGAPAADPRLRPGVGRRLLSRIRRRRDRAIPVRALAEFHVAELTARLEAAAGQAASLDSIALATVRAQLHDVSDPVRLPAPGAPAPPAPPAVQLEGALAGAARAVDTAIEETVRAFERDLLAPAVQVDPDLAPAVRERAKRRRERLRRDWESFEKGLHANTAAEAVLAAALARLDTTAATASRQLDETLEARARGPLSRLAHGLGKLADEAAARLEDEPLADVIPELRTAASTLFEAELPTVLRDLPVALDQAAETFLAELASIPDSVPEGLRISERRIQGIPSRPDRLELRDAPIGELIAAACTGTLPRWTQRALETAAEELDALSQELQRVRNAVDFHIRAPLRGGFGDEEAAELVEDIMRRAASQLEELRETGLDAVERMIAELERRCVQEGEEVRSTVAEREFLRIRSEIAEEQAVRQLSRSAEWARRLMGAGFRIARRGWSAGRHAYERTQLWAERQLGVSEVEREDMLESLEESLLGEDRGSVALPGLYRQLFDVEGEVPWEELLVPRDEELAAMGRAIERWRRGQSGAVAVVGEKGSGKTTLLRMAGESLFGDLPVYTLEIGSTVEDPEELLRRIDQGLDLDAGDWQEVATGLRERRPAVVIVEDAHNLFIRALGGFRAVEAFLELLNSTRRDVFWILTMDEYAWRYLDRVLGLAPHFTHVVSTTNLSPVRLERAIMSRHDVSGFSLEFELEADGVAPTRWWSRIRRKEPQGELTRRERERGEFFRELNLIAEGNIFLGLFYWLRSIRRVEDHMLILGRPRMIDLEFLERLPLPSLHSIAGIILHGGLSGEEHQRIFQLDPAESRLQLASLADAHLIFRSSDGEYKVNKVLYRPLTRLLRAKNIF